MNAAETRQLIKQAKKIMADQAADANSIETIAEEASELVSRPRPVSPAKLAANRANSQKSTGPTTQIGKATARYNAVRHNLTGRLTILPTEDATCYTRHCLAFHLDLKPLGLREELLVQNIADHQWRLNRIPALEAGVYAMGRASRTPTRRNPAVKADNFEAIAYVEYEQQLRNLCIQESRLKRYLKHDLAELESLQQARFAEEQQEFEAAAARAAEAKALGEPFHPEHFGFVFSSSDLQAFTDANGNLRLAKKFIAQRAATASAAAAAIAPATAAEPLAQAA